VEVIVEKDSQRWDDTKLVITFVLLIARTLKPSLTGRMDTGSTASGKPQCLKFNITTVVILKKHWNRV